MKKSKLLSIIAIMLALTIGVFTLTACGSGTDYVFEAEHAVLEGSTVDYTGATCEMSVETGNEYVGFDDEGTLLDGTVEVTNIGNFNAIGQTITWRITASKECDATITLRACSAVFSMAEDWSSFGMAEVDMSKNEVATLKVNDAVVALEGVLPGLSELGWDVMASEAYATIYRHFGEATGKIHLQEGENVIVLAIVGTTGGINVDKITINASAELSFEKTNNG